VAIEGIREGDSKQVQDWASQIRGVARYALRGETGLPREFTKERSAWSKKHSRGKKMRPQTSHTLKR